MFRLGPCFITKDVPITNETNEPPKSDQVNIRLPILTGKRESYQWLQPYVTDEHDEASTAYKRISVEVDGVYALDSLTLSSNLYAGID